MTATPPWPKETWALLILVALEIAHQFTGIQALGWATFAALGVAIVTALPRLGLREGYLISLSLVMMVLLWLWHPEPLQASERALNQAVFLMAFLLSISLIQEAAQTSRSVAALGRYLANQPGGRRYVGLYTGTMGMAVIFNIGTLSLLAPLITRAAEKPADTDTGDVSNSAASEIAVAQRLAQTRERRQLNAVIRGFSWSVVWSPTAIAPLALFTLLPEANRTLWIGLGLGLAMLMLLIGWAEDRIAWRHMTAEALGRPPIPVPPLPRRAAARFTGVCLGLAVVTGVLMLVLNLGVPAALMGAAPLIMAGWLYLQEIDAKARITEIAREGVPATVPAAITLAAAGFVGIAGADLLPAQAIADWIDLDAAPEWLFLTGTIVAVVALSQFGLSPIMMAVFFGAVLSALDSLPADVTLTALAVAAGLAVSTTFSPFAAGVVFLSGVTPHSGIRLTYVWNGLFSAMSFGAMVLFFVVVTGGQ